MPSLPMPLVAQMAFQINDRYGSGGMTEEEVDRQLEQLQGGEASPSHLRIVQRLLQKKRVFQSKGKYYVNPQREFVEYLHFILCYF